MELLFKVEDYPVRFDPLKGVENKNSRRYREIRESIKPEYVYTWSISNYLGWEDNPLVLSFQPDLRTFPSVGIISSDEFIRNLNDWKCFGNLNYLPLERDCVTINYCYIDFYNEARPKKYSLFTIEWMQALFKDGKWIRDRYYHAKLNTVEQGVLYMNNELE